MPEEDTFAPLPDVHDARWRRRAGVWLACAFLSLALPGCVGWRSAVDPHVERFETLSPVEPTGSAPTLKLTVTADRDGKEQDDLAKRYLEEGIEVLRQSGRFSEVDVDLEGADLELVLHVDERESFDGSLMMLSAMTLTAVPTYDRFDVRASGQVIGTDGTPLTELTVRESLTVLVWLPAFPLIPLAASAIDNSYADVFRSALVQMVAEPAVWDPSQAAGKIRASTMSEAVAARWARLEEGMSIEEAFLLLPEFEGPEVDPESVRKRAGKSILRLQGSVGTLFFEPCRRRNANDRCIQDGPHRLYRWSERTCTDLQGGDALAPREQRRLVTIETCPSPGPPGSSELPPRGGASTAPEAVNC
jgi:hypothetical protein